MTEKTENDYLNNAKKYYLQDQNNEQAINELNEGISKYPFNIELLMQRANLNKISENYQTANIDYTEVIRLDPNNEGAYYDRSKCYNEINEKEKALKDINTAIQINPNEYSYYIARAFVYNLNDKDNAIKDLNKAEVLNSSEFKKLGHNLDRGTFYFYDKEYDKAIIDYTKAIEHDNNNYNAYNNRGNAYRKKGDLNNAIKDFSKAIENISNTNEDKYFLCEYFVIRGMCYRDLQQYDNAIKDFSEALKINEYWDIYHFRGHSYYCKNEFKKALDDFGKAIELYIIDPDKDDKVLADIYGWRGVIYTELKKNNKARDDFLTAIKLDDSNENYKINLSNIK